VAYLHRCGTPLEPDVRQEILELDPVEAKLRRLVDLLQRELAVRSWARRSPRRPKSASRKPSASSTCGNSCGSIQTELGEKGEADATDETAELRRQIEAAQRLPRRPGPRPRGNCVAWPDGGRLAEYGLTRVYLEWMQACPGPR